MKRMYDDYMQLQIPMKGQQLNWDKVLKYSYFKRGTDFNPYDIKRWADQIREETKSSQILVVYDSLQRGVTFNSNMLDRRTLIDKKVNELEKLSLEDSDLVILMLSELPRTSYNGKKSDTFAFKESGDTEYACRVALTLTDSEKVSSEAFPDYYDTKVDLRIMKDSYLGSANPSVPVASYTLRYPYWTFLEEKLQGVVQQAKAQSKTKGKK